MESSFYDKNGNIIDYYTIFNLPHNAALEEVRTAFRNLIRKYHPDTSVTQYDHIAEKIDLIIRGYRVLSNEISRFEYDRHLFKDRSTSSDGYSIISKKRIRYSASLKEMLKARLLPKGVKHKDILFNFGQDIEISISAAEAKTGAIAYIELPARMICPVCKGSDPHCYICRGIGRINTSSQIEIKIPPHVDDSTYIDVDLMKMKPDNSTSFCLHNLRIKISVDEKVVKH